jgi:hypothetical protein
MPLRWKILIVLLLLAGTGLGACWYVNRDFLQRHWMIYQVGAVPTYQEAKPKLAWFDGPPDRIARLPSLAGRFGRGNGRFDLYLAQYVVDPDSSDSLRQTFSTELAARDGLLARWAGYWSWQLAQAPDAEIASILDYLEALNHAPSRTLTWREVLDLQAVFQWTGRPGLARGLSPGNWRERYRQWQLDHPSRLPHVERPSEPMPGS